MSTELIILIIVLVLLFGGGGGYYWEWFRLDGTKMRSGHFENNEQIGEWTTYDKKGQVYKVTNIFSMSSGDESRGG